MATSDQNIVLTGFMATGKSTIGAILAAHMDRVFFDIDIAIQYRTGLTIPTIFDQYGETFFRAIEKGLCHEVCLRRNLVVATGGGAVLDTVSRENLINNAFVVCLSASRDEIEARITMSTQRPLAGTWKQLLTDRQPIYEQLPNQIDTTGKSPTELAEEISTLWQNQFV